MIPEIVSGPGEKPQRFVWHLMDGPWLPEASFQPIICGDGIAFPWRERRPVSDLCSECAAIITDRAL